MALNILTKICVVVLVVASLVACVVFINLATLSPNYRELYENKLEENKGLVSACQNHMEAANRAGLELQQSRQTGSAREATLQKESDRLQIENRGLKVENAGLKNQLSDINSQLASLGKTKEALVKQLENQNAEIQKVWNERVKLQQENNSLKDQCSEAQARSERLEKNSRVLKEQNENFRQQNIELTQKVKNYEARGGPKEEEPVLSPESKIAGTVVAVRNNVASVNVGSAHGVKKGMQLIVFRGDQFVGYLKVEQVDVNESAGVMTKRVLAPMQGDKVASDLE
jgi:myosin heavy subunit